MTHHIEAFVAKLDFLDNLPRFTERSVIIRLRQGFGMMIEPGNLDYGLWDDSLGEDRVAYGAARSKGGQLASIFTCYSGGTGAQAAALWIDGALAVPFTLGPSGGPISEVLRRMGARRRPGDRDEFEAVGFDSYRVHEDWVSFSKTGKADWQKAPTWTDD
jgi:hypothetical protein